MAARKARKQSKVTTAPRHKQKNELSAFVVKLRSAYGMSQRQFAARFDVDDSSIAQAEAGYYKKPMELIKKLWPSLRIDERDKLLAILIGITKLELDATIKEQ